MWPRLEPRGSLITPPPEAVEAATGARAGLGAETGSGAGGGGGEKGFGFASWGTGLVGAVGRSCRLATDFFKSFENRPNIAPPVQAHHAPLLFKRPDIQKRGPPLNPPTLSSHFVDPSNRPADREVNDKVGKAKWAKKVQQFDNPQIQVGLVCASPLLKCDDRTDGTKANAKNAEPDKDSAAG